MPIKSAIPLVLYSYTTIFRYQETLNSYFLSICILLSVTNPLRLLMSLLVIPLSGIEFLSHYEECYQEIQGLYEKDFPLYGRDKIAQALGMLKTSMLAWKLLLFQAHLLKTHQSSLLDMEASHVLDIDGSILKSFSSVKEGSEVGFNRKYRGKPCFQLSASYINRVFIDGRLFPGHCNPKVFFQKAVKRARSLGYRLHTVRADSAYLTAENLRFLKTLSLGYAIGAPSTFSVVKQGRQDFKRLSRKKHHSIVPLTKGVSALDLGEVLIGDVATRIIIVRRIQRRKNRKTGTWKIKTYFYAIATSSKDSPRKVFNFYHQRQCIESGFRELKDHYALERLPVKNLKGNEFWLICKMIAMTLVKLFQDEMLPKALQYLMRATLLRRILRHLLFLDLGKKVQIRRKTRHRWVLQRLIPKLERMKDLAIP